MRIVSACLAVLFFVPSLHAEAPPAKRPNVVLILTDDMGYADLGCYGSKDIRTPHVDRLAAAGVRLTHFYSNGPVCTPTRAAGLLTGLARPLGTPLPINQGSPTPPAEA